MSLLLEGKRAFVSGGTRGLGKALCEVFAREGADVAFNYHASDDLATEVVRLVESHGRPKVTDVISASLVDACRYLDFNKKRPIIGLNSSI